MALNHSFDPAPRNGRMSLKLRRLNVTRFGMTVDQAINAPDFFKPATNNATSKLTANVPKGRFPKSVLDEMGYAYQEIDDAKRLFAGEGLWVGVSRDPKTGELARGLRKSQQQRRRGLVVIRAGSPAETSSAS
jgi:hypothetical protein